MPTLTDYVARKETFRRGWEALMDKAGLVGEERVIATANHEESVRLIHRAIIRWEPEDGEE